MKERILLIGPPGGGKSYQIKKIIESLTVPIYLIDLEDKIAALFENDKPANLRLWVAPYDWDEYKQAADEVLKLCKEGEWIMIDRVDLSWPRVQNWYSRQKYDDEMADRMLETAKRMKSTMKLPRFDMGAWQVINEQYDSVHLKLLYKSRCNVIMTSGISVPDNNTMDVFGIGVNTRGQKELGHQPHSVFLLNHKKLPGKPESWHIVTAKDLEGRDKFSGEEIYDLSVQYLSKYLKG